MDVILALASLVAIVIAAAASRDASNLRRRLDQLKADVARLQTEVFGEEIRERAGVQTAQAQPVSMPPAPTLSEAASSIIDAAGVPDPIGMLAPATMALPVMNPKRPFRPLFERARSTEEWEALIGGRWLNRMGALALILGMAFFLKYAIDNNWISQPIRVAIGLVVGFGLLGGAREMYRRDLPIFAQGLLGAGLAILYVSLYAASNLYHLVPVPIALAAMGGVTVLGLVQALYYNSLTVALLAWIGGFATVPLLGISGGDTLGVIGYVVLLDAGILAIVARRDDWFVLEPLAMGATYAIYFGWQVTHDLPSTHIPTVLPAAALTLFWVLFYALDVWRIFSRVETWAGLRHLLGAANAALYLAGMAILLANATEVGLFSLALATVYVVTVLLAKRGLTGDRLDARYALTAILLAVLATPLLAPGLLLPILWSLEALALLWAGIHWKLWYAWWPALCLYGIASLTLLGTPGAITYSHAGRFIPLFNERALAFLVLIGTLVAGSRFLKRLPHKRGAAFIVGFQYAWCATLLLLLAVETNDFFRRQMLGSGALNRLYLEQLRSLVMAAVWMAFSLPLVRYSLRARVFPLLSSGLAAAALATALGAGAGFSYQPIERFTPILNDRALVFALLIGGLVVHYRTLAREREAYPWVGTAIAGYQAVIILFGFELVSAEINDYFRHATGVLSESGGAAGVFVELLSLSAIWLLYSFPLVRYGIRNRALSVLLIGLGSLGAATGAGAIASIVYQPTNWLGLALSLRPLIVLLLMVGLLLQSRIIREAQHVFRWLDTVLLALQACTVLLGLELISAQTRDVFRHQIAAASVSQVQTLLNLQQLTYSVVWLLYAIGLLIVGFWRRVRWLRLGGIALLAGITLKIVGYDLSFLTPAYRSISFAGLGVVLLSSSYLYQRYRSRLLEAG